MAKLFYTIDEAAAKLGKTKTELLNLVGSGQLEEFKMHDQVHFKRAVIDQLVLEEVGDFVLPLDDSGAVGSESSRSGNGGDELKFEDSGADAKPLDLDLGLDSGLEPGLDLGLDLGLDHGLDHGLDAPLTLADSAAASKADSGERSAPSLGAKPSSDELDLGLDLGLDDLASPSTGNLAQASGLGLDLADSRASSPPRAAASDASGSMAARSGVGSRDDSAAFPTRGGVSDSGALSLETVGSGSGMLDLTGDADQSTMGAALLDDPGDEGASGAPVVSASGIFAEPAMAGAFEEEAPAAPRASSGGGTMMAGPATVDTAGSGLGVGMLVVALVAVLVSALIVMGSRLSGGSQLAAMITGDMLVWVGALAAGTLIAGGIGFFVGRAME